MYEIFILNRPHETVAEQERKGFVKDEDPIQQTGDQTDLLANLVYIVNHSDDVQQTGYIRRISLRIVI